MERFAAMVRTGDPVDHKTQQQVAGVLGLHIDEGCWSSARQYTFRSGTPVIASHIGAGQGQFLVGVLSGDEMTIPWKTAPEHADHIGYEVAWMNAVFVGDPDAIVGATGRGLQWLSETQFNDAWGRLRVRHDDSTEDY